MVAVLPHFFYDIKYVGGTEQRVDACFIEKAQLVSSFCAHWYARTFCALSKNSLLVVS